MSVPNIFYKLKNCKLNKFKIVLAFLSESVRQKKKSTADDLK